MSKLKIVLTASIGFALAAAGFMACKKNATPTQSTSTKVENNLSNLPTNEIKFAPKDRTEAGKLAVNFLKHTKFSPVKVTRDGPPTSYPTHMAAWLFEAGANFLENDNNVNKVSSTSTIIPLPRLSNGEVNAATLIDAFNTFIAAIEANPNVVPKLINVTIEDELASEMHIKIDVDFGDAPAGTVVYPTTGMYYTNAATWLSNTFSNENSNGPIAYPAQGTAYAWQQNCVGLFWYNVQIVSPLCYGFPALTELPDPWLWTAYVANANPLDPFFKAADFPIYYNKMVTVANNLNATSTNNQKVISINVKGFEVIAGYNPNSCQPVGSIIDGYVHTQSSITMANLGCLPYPY